MGIKGVEGGVRELRWWLFGVPRPFVRPGAPSPWPSPAGAGEGICPRWGTAPFVLRTFPPRAGETPPGPLLISLWKGEG